LFCRGVMLKPFAGDLVTDPECASIPASIPAPIPATLIGGYLGAGKTTLINHLLRQAQGTRIAVLVNDFGDINIDADLIESRDGGVLSLSGGCICCSFGSDLMATLLTVAQMQPPPQHLLIETSGVALPSSVASSLKLASGIALKAIVVLIDAQTIVAKLVDRYVGDTVSAQVRAADVLVINKSDLADGETIAALTSQLLALTPNALTVIAQRAAIDPAMVLGGLDRERPFASAAAAHPLTRESNPSPSPQARSRQPFAHRRARPPRNPFASLTVRFTEAIDAELLAASLSEPQLGLYRAKALARRPDGSGVSIQWVGAHCEVRDSNHRELQQGRLVCIGANGAIDEAAIRQRLAAASL
jgi:G3E family GTPase